VLFNFRGKSDTILQKSGIINGGKGLFSRAVLYLVLALIIDIAKHPTEVAYYYVSSRVVRLAIIGQ
jgi:hypothetical protein